MAYTRTIKYKDWERPVKLDTQTGEYIETRNTFPKTPDDMQRWLDKDPFEKKFIPIAPFLEKELNSDEYKIVGIMSRMCHPINNSLAPLDDDTSLRDLENCFHINKNKLRKILDKLFVLGVFARFDVYKPEVPYTKYWIFNPYISTKSRYININIASLFDGTTIEKEYTKAISKVIKIGRYRMDSYN